MTAVLDVAPAGLVPAGGNAFPDDAAVGLAREARIFRHARAPVIDARLFAAGCGWDWHLSDDDIDTLVLIVAELVDNALRHAVWPKLRHVVLVRISMVGSRVVIEVRDPDTVMPRWPGAQVWNLAVINGPADADAEALIHGRGLGIVSALTEALGAAREPVGKVVRAVLLLAQSG